MIPRRLSPSASPLPASSASGEPPPQNTIEDSTPLQTLPTPAGMASPNAAPARKRLLPLPATPHPTRLRTDPGPLQAAPAVPPRSHAALQRQTQAFAAIAKALGQFGGMRWLTLDEAHRQALLAVATDLPSASPSSDVTETEQRQQRLHAMLSSIQQIEQDMDWLSRQHPLSPRVIEPAMLTAFVPAVHYGQVTIEGPYREEAGQAHFYLERQDGHACARHAINAMVGGPLVSLVHFAQWEARVQVQQDLTPAALAQMAADMREQGVHLETVQGTLESLGIPTHLYAHRPIPHIQGLDPAQARFLDGLPTDRLLLQADRYEGNSATSHYVAFRRDAGQWVLLDSLHGAPQYEVAPSAYLLRDEQILHFTALWPQHALQERAPAHESGDGRLEQEGAESIGAARMEEGMPPHPQEGKVGARAKAPRKPTVSAPSEMQQKFLKGLVPYAAGKSIAECGRESGWANFDNHFLSTGGLQKDGQVFYDKLPPEQQAEVDQAIAARKVALVEKAMDTVSIMEKFLAGLPSYAAGKSLAECGRESGLTGFPNYLSATGGLQKIGWPLYAKLPPEQQAEVDQAIAARKVALVEKAMDTVSILEKVLAGLPSYAAGKSRAECGRESGLTYFDSYFSAAGGLKRKSQALYDKLPPEGKAEVDQAIRARKELGSTLDKFLRGLKPYAAGKSLTECELESGSASFHRYLSAMGGLQKDGQTLYAKLPPEQQAEVDQAIKKRQALSKGSTVEKFLAGLEPYAAGKTLKECEHESGLTGFPNYLSATGGLQKPGRSLYAKLPPEQQAKVDGARLSRTVWFAREKIDSKRFLDAIHRFSTSSLQIEAIEQAVGLKKRHLGLLLCDTGLTEAGRRYVEEKFSPQEQEEIQRCIHLRVPPP